MADLVNLLEEAICGNLYDSRGPLGEGCLLVDKDRGVILDVKKEVRGVRKHDFRGKGLLVLPGLIDLHVHLRGLKLSYKEDEFTGTVAALSKALLTLVFTFVAAPVGSHMLARSAHAAGLEQWDRTLSDELAEDQGDHPED